jgi:predicted nucleotidyltransferase
VDTLMLLKELKQRLVQRFGDEIKYVILFGSQAKGMAQDDSDYDILVVLEHAYDWRMRRQISHACYDIDLKYDILTDVTVISLKELQSQRGYQPFIINAMNEGIAV